MDSPTASPNKTSTESPRKRKRNEFSVTAKSMQYFKPLSAEVTKMTKKTHSCILCNEMYNGQREHNLAKHLLNSHPSEYKLVADYKEAPTVKRLRLLQNLTEIVSFNGRPFEYLHDSGFQKIIQEQLAELQAAGQGINLSDNNLTEVKEHLKQTAQKIREIIKKEVKNMPISLIVDAVTKHDRAILGVSIQYALNGHLKVRSIGMIELTQKHTAHYLAEVIVNRLNELGIELRQILTITTDNAANCLKMIRDLNGILQNKIDGANQQQNTTETNQQHTSTVSNDLNEEDEDALIESLLARPFGNSDEEAIDMLIGEVFNENETRPNDGLFSNISSELASSGINILFNITGVNCVAHTLQLAVKDAIRDLPQRHRNVIESCRNICKFIRLKSCCVDMAKLNIPYKKPRIETPTRWGSMYLMLSDVFNNEKIIRHYENAEHEISKFCKSLIKKWSILKELIYLLRIPYNGTIEFQSQKLTVSDVYNRWTLMELRCKKCESLRAYKTGLATNLLKALQIRHANIFGNPLMASALYLDPRFQKVITKSRDKTAIAKENILKIGHRLFEKSCDTNISTNSTDSLSYDFNEQDAMETHINQVDTTFAQSEQNNGSKGVDLETLVDTFQPDQLPNTVSVLEWWESKKTEYPELYDIAMVIYSVPPTEVQIERDFSSLNFVFTYLRSGLHHDRLEDIMLIFLNKELYEIVCENDLLAAITNSI